MVRFSDEWLKGWDWELILWDLGGLGFTLARGLFGIGVWVTGKVFFIVLFLGGLADLDCMEWI